MFDKRADKKSENSADSNEVSKPSRRDAAVTAEFDYIDDWGDESSEKDGPSSELKLHAGGAHSADEDPVTRAVDASDLHTHDYPPSENVPGALSVSGSAPGTPQTGAGAWGYDQPQVSGVFSRYDEETQDADSGEFDLFEDTPSEPSKPEHPLRDVVSTHDKKIRRLRKQVAYQKEIIQVISELLVESTVISRHELKKRLRALREKSR